MVERRSDDTSNEKGLFRALKAEFARLELDLHALPGGGLAMGPVGVDELLRRLRQLQPPVTWREIFPDLPAHWAEGRPETWTPRYAPFGAYDYQELPTSPAVHIHWPKDEDPSCLDRFVAAARQAGWGIYGGGFIDVTNPEWPTLDAIVVLARDTTQATLNAFLRWLEKRPDVRLAAIPRNGTEEYVQDH
jgi:hypothetical protein